jgi:Nitroreductase family
MLLRHFTVAGTGNPTVKISLEKNFIAQVIKNRRMTMDVQQSLLSRHLSRNPALGQTARYGCTWTGPGNARQDCANCHANARSWQAISMAFLKANPDARPAQIEAAVAPVMMAPVLVILLFAPQSSSKIPLWEQQLSVGAAAMNLLHAAHAHGFVASWITGWASYDATVRAVLCQGDEKIAGFFFIGTAGQPLEERPRPDPDSILRQWP